MARYKSVSGKELAERTYPHRVDGAGVGSAASVEINRRQIRIGRSATMGPQEVPMAEDDQSFQYRMEKWRADREHSIEKWRADREHATERWRTFREENLSLMDGVVSLAGHALKAATLINGGAAIALLAFVAHLAAVDFDGNQDLILGLANPMSDFVAGVLFGAIAAGCSYSAQYVYLLVAHRMWADEIAADAEHNRMAAAALKAGDDPPEKQKLTYSGKTKSCIAAAIIFHTGAVGLVIGCYFLFIRGAWRARDVIFFGLV